MYNLNKQINFRHEQIRCTYSILRKRPPPKRNEGEAQFVAILSRFVGGRREWRAPEKGKGDEGLNPEGRGRVCREVTCMLDMCDPHDFCYRETRQPSWHTYTLTFGDPEARIRTPSRAVNRWTVPRACVGVSFMLLTNVGATAIGGRAAVTIEGERERLLDINSVRDWIIKSV